MTTSTTTRDRLLDAGLLFGVLSAGLLAVLTALPDQALGGITPTQLVIIQPAPDPAPPIGEGGWRTYLENECGHVLARETQGVLELLLLDAGERVVYMTVHPSAERSVVWPRYQELIAPVVGCGR